MNTQTDTVTVVADHDKASNAYTDFSGLLPFALLCVIAAMLAVGLPVVLGVVAMTVRP